jgi:hypothetical protein
MKKLVTFPIHSAWRAIVLPAKVLIASLGLTFRAGIKVGALPVKGSAVVTRALGWKIVGAVTVGVVIGIVIGRQIGLMSRSHDHDHGHDHDADFAFDGADTEVAA